VKRREFITLLGSVATALPHWTRGQQAQSMPSVGVLMSGAVHQEKSLFNSSVRATFPARFADTVASK
jgi:hypothetical protein